MKDDNKKQESIIVRVPARLFRAFDPGISEYKLLKKIKKLYLFIFLLIVVSLLAYGIIFHPDATAVTCMVILITIIAWAAISEMIF